MHSIAKDETSNISTKEKPDSTSDGNPTQENTEVAAVKGVKGRYTDTVIDALVFEAGEEVRAGAYSITNGIRLLTEKEDQSHNKTYRVYAREGINGRKKN